MSQAILIVEMWIDGVPVDGAMGMPYAHRLDADAEHIINEATKLGVSPNAFPVVPTQQLSNVQGIAFKTTKPGTLRVNGQLSGGIPVLEGALIVIWDTDLDYSEVANVTMALGAEVEAKYTGLAVGEPVVPSDGTGYGEGGYGEGGFG